MSRVLIRQLLIEGSGHHLPHLVSELLNFGEGRIHRRTLWPEAASRHCGNALLELLLRLLRQHDSILSVLAHATFLPKQARLPNH
jgi:hypothetical protein